MKMLIIYPAINGEKESFEWVDYIDGSEEMDSYTCPNHGDTGYISKIA